MKDAPERIWAIPSLGGEWGDGLGMWWPEDTNTEPQAEFVRADLHAAALDREAALRAEVERLRDKIANATHSDFIWGALDNVHDIGVTLDAYADAVSRAQRAALAGTETEGRMITKTEAKAMVAAACQLTLARAKDGVFLVPAGAKAALDRLLRDAVNRGLERAAGRLDAALADAGDHPTAQAMRRVFAEEAAAIRALKEPTE